MPFVLDASTALDWAMKEGRGPADAARDRLRSEDALTPALWWFEIRNGLIINERRGRLDQRGSEEFLQNLAVLPIVTDNSPNEAGVMTLARRYRLTVYDAAYLELALREGLELATLDALLAEAARQEGVAVVGDAA